ncbi:ABC transporter ATP-binding protein [Natranaerofaba carboxydovora]|uniref:ABC transporter ATP-binding protein n=1 Tax=Natranaerofaba carboxydovora TaxID=2742683 RepID=UPI003B847AA5
MFYLKNLKYKEILNIHELEIKNKKVTCILGESGSGKTTLLKLLNQIITHDHGEIFYNDKPINEIDTITLRREVVMLPQNPIITEGSIKDNLNLGLILSEQPLKEDNSLIELLKLFKLDKDLEDDATKLSGGEKQRIALARLMLMEPEVFLLDEPSSALDENLENYTMEKFIDYSTKRNKTVVMITHSRKIGEAFADYIINIENGKILSTA